MNASKLLGCFDPLGTWLWFVMAAVWAAGLVVVGRRYR